MDRSVIEFEPSRWIASNYPPVSEHRVFQICNSSKSHIKRGLCERSLYSDSLRAGRSGDRIPVGVRYSARLQTGPGAHTASYTMGTGYFPGVKRPGRGVDHPSPYLAPMLKKEYSYTSTPPLGLRSLLYGDLYLYLYHISRFMSFLKENSLYRWIFLTEMIALYSKNYSRHVVYCMCWVHSSSVLTFRPLTWTVVDVPHR